LIVIEAVKEPLEVHCQGGLEMATEESADDDLWDFSTPGGLVPVEISSGGDTDDDGINLLPASKRRKLQKAAHLPDIVPIDDESDSQSDDSDLEIVEEMKAASKKREEDRERIRFPEACSISVAPRHKQSDRDMASKAQSMRNRALLEGLKASLHAQTPEPGDQEDDYQRQCEEAAEPEERGGGAQAADLDRLVLKIKARGQDNPIKIKIGKRRPLSILFDKFREIAEQKAWIDEGAKLKFMFDGDVMYEDDTCDDLDIEEDCVIEVYW